MPPMDHALSHVIIGVHGLSRKPPEDAHRQGWIQAVQEGLRRNSDLEIGAERLGLDLIYWADWLGAEPYGPGEDPEPYTPAEGTGPLPAYRDRFRDRIFSRLLDRIGDSVDRANALSLVEQLRERVGLDDISAKLLALRLVDLGTYYGDTEKRIFLRRKLRDKLASHQGKRIMLIAHSMGSIVAYDVLRDLGREMPDVRVDHFVTIGSPLGMPYVLDRIRRESASVRTPSIVRRWSNLADRRDPIAIDVHLADEFEPNDRGIAVEDQLVINGYRAPNGKSNPHKIYGYLRTPELSELIRKFI